MFRMVNGKLGNMRKSVDWVVCPVTTDEPDERTIQSDNRIARINMKTGKGVLSDGKGGHQGFHKLSSAFGAKEVDCPQDILDQLNNLDEDHGVQSGAVTVLTANGPAPTVHARK